MTEQSKYAGRGRDDLLELVASRGIEVQGTGADGYVKVEDLLEALDAADQAADDAATHFTDEQVREAPDGPAPASGALQIERQNDTTWWCPFDDHSMNQLVETCAKCGARRDGDYAERS